MPLAMRTRAVFWARSRRPVSRCGISTSPPTSSTSRSGSSCPRTSGRTGCSTSPELVARRARAGTGRPGWLELCEPGFERLHAVLQAFTCRRLDGDRRLDPCDRGVRLLREVVEDVQLQAEENAFDEGDRRADDGLRRKAELRTEPDSWPRGLEVESLDDRDAGDLQLDVGEVVGVFAGGARALHAVPQLEDDLLDAGAAVSLLLPHAVRVSRRAC